MISGTFPGCPWIRLNEYSFRLIFRLNELVERTIRLNECIRLTISNEFPVLLAVLPPSFKGIHSIGRPAKGWGSDLRQSLCFPAVSLVKKAVPCKQVCGDPERIH